MDTWPTLRHVERVGHAHDPRLERQRSAGIAVARDRLENLRREHRPLRLVVETLQQLPELRLGEEQTEVLVPVSVHGHAHAVQETPEADDHLGVVSLEAVVADHRRLDTVLGQLAQQLEGDVRDDLDVDPRVVVDLEPRERVDVRHVPPALQLPVGIDALEQRAQLAVPPRGHVDPHARDGLGRRQARFPLGLDRDGLRDAVLGRPVERHRYGGAGTGSTPTSLRARR